MKLSKLRGVAIVIGLFALPSAALCARMLLSARAEIQRAQACDKPRERVRHLRRAMAHYLPLNPWVRQAARKLARLARGAESEGKRALALHAWGELRSGLLALRSTYQPLAETLPEANRRIAALSGDQPGVARSLTTPAGRAGLLRRLETPPQPHAGWAALGMLGFVSWIGGAVALLLLGLRADAGLTSRFLPLSLTVVVGLFLFCLGMASA